MPIILKMKEISQVLQEFKHKRILVVGEISAAKCKEFTSNDKDTLPASAALVSIYAANLGATVSLVGTVGPDIAGSEIISKLRKNKVNISGITVDPRKPTLCWKKVFKGQAETGHNIVTEKQIIESTLKLAFDSRAILYISQNPSSFSHSLYNEIKKIGKGLRIPVAFFSRLPFSHTVANTEKNNLHISHKNNDIKIGKGLQAKSRARQCLVINNKTGFNLISSTTIKTCRVKNKTELYQYEAALTAISVLLLACYNSAEYLTTIAKYMTISGKGLSISKARIAS